MNPRYVLVPVLSSMAALGCGDASKGATSERDAPTATTATSAAYRAHAAATLARSLGRTGVVSQLVDALRARREGVELEALDALVPALRGDVAPLALAQTTSLPSGELPEVWLYEPPADLRSGEEPVVAFPPAGNDGTWTRVTAYGLDGREITLDARTPPTRPVVVVETHGRRALREGVREVNAALARAGLQPRPTTGALRPTNAGTDGTWTVRLDSIQLTNDEEPWVSGGAEVYAIASGVVGANQPALRLVDLPYLDDDGKAYQPTQVVLDWSEYGCQAANIQLFEQDSDTNYRDLVSALIAAVGAAGSLAGRPEINAVTEIANRIVQAMPDSWFMNDDDYVDSFYTVEKYVSYVDRWGAAGNARVTLTPFFVKANP